MNYRVGEGGAAVAISILICAIVKLFEKSHSDRWQFSKSNLIYSECTNFGLSYCPTRLITKTHLS